MTTIKNEERDAKFALAVDQGVPQPILIDGQTDGVEAAQKAGGVSESTAALAELRAGSRGWIDWAQNAGKANFRAWQALLSCRSVPGAATIYGELAQEQSKLLLDSGRVTMGAMIHDASAPRA